MHSLLLSLATTPSPLPTPTLRDGISEDQVTPGLLGFIMTAFFVIATALLIVDMVRRIRRVRYRAQVEEERMAAAASADIDAADAQDGFDGGTHRAAPDANGNGQAGGLSQPRE
ncbi:hypothetical protein [Pseudarthrobacter sp. C4D7]|uniref:hypothetical protein n=1 Tax=Pseudarthrobacter sp. C4D7 TaxID=2735268 RepID=UPI0015844DFE|nr:hypothetical protein [Pseudarthrobacter sp. C4D7]